MSDTVYTYSLCGIPLECPVPEVHAAEWIDRCSKSLQEHWRTVAPERLDDVAGDLWAESSWRAMTPEQAAVEWLKLGVLTDD